MSSTTKTGKNYAKALFQTLINFEKARKTGTEKISTLIPFQEIDENQEEIVVSEVSIIGEELILLKSLVSFSTKFKEGFNNPIIPEQQKLNLILNIFPGISSIMRSFLRVLKDKSQLNLIPEIAEEYNEILLKFKNSVRVKLITGSVLQEQYGLILLKTLKNLTKADEVILEVSYNPQLLGGLILEYNSKSTDASILKEFSLFLNET
jgi:ATP synthase F1 delta subunit